MKLLYEKAQLNSLNQAESFRVILGNGLGGFLAVTAAFSVTRGDDGILCSAVQIPNERRMLVHRLKETLELNGKSYCLSSQQFADGTKEEKGYQYLERFSMDALPVWNYHMDQVQVERTCTILHEKNQSAVFYSIRNESKNPARFTVDPGFFLAGKGNSWQKKHPAISSIRIGDKSFAEACAASRSIIEQAFLKSPSACDTSAICMEGCTDLVIVSANGKIREIPQREELLAYPADALDGRPEKGYEAHRVEIIWDIPAEITMRAEILFSGESFKVDSPAEAEGQDSPAEAEGQDSSAEAEGQDSSAEAEGQDSSAEAEGQDSPAEAAGQDRTAEAATEEKTTETVAGRIIRMLLQKDPLPHVRIAELLRVEAERREALLNQGDFHSEEARELSRATDLYLCRKEATDGYTLIAGYPFFGDWGRDTMISLPGCMLSTKRYDKAREILQTFLSYERNGLVPNLFPEEGKEPMYNSVDAPLLLIESIYLYVKRTGDLNFVKKNWKILEHIIECYVRGTDYAIRMDDDGLIEAGEKKWQLTWMDVCVNGVLPTPRHGKPVEINAYWYNALKIMEEFARKIEEPCNIKKAWKNGKDVNYGQIAEQVKKSFLDKFWMAEKGYLKDVLSGDKAENQIRCNQIWALTMSFTMLNAGQEKAVLETIEKYLLTTRGLRTLSTDDPEYHGFYGGDQFLRDMAYHQGTIWVFPLGAYYRAYLKVYNRSQAAIAYVKDHLAVMKEMLREGCAGQLPEIYDGDHPYQSKGCYAQCWSVGEMLRVYEELEQT